MSVFRVLQLSSRVAVALPTSMWIPTTVRPLAIAFGRGVHSTSTLKARRNLKAWRVASAAAARGTTAASARSRTTGPGASAPVAPRSSRSRLVSSTPSHGIMSSTGDPRRSLERIQGLLLRRDYANRNIELRVPPFFPPSPSVPPGSKMTHVRPPAPATI
ncbi:hypothetical protein K438DRAFT_2020909 [Mycena galopus ATCC 62051]|nr:hypothetical protein K438DRAFT_2020909 [Mycena galopus ATCC 62051]